MTRFSLNGTRAFVTGANTGIGQAIAIDLARQGAHVIAVGRSNMDDTLAAVREVGGLADPLIADLGSVARAIAAFGDASERFGPIDILVNNAGIIRRADSLDFSEQDWDDVMDLNLKVVFFLSQAFARACIAADRSGSIINIASILSFQGGIRIPSYSAAKSGLAGLTKTLSNEWSARGITVNAVAPGYVETNNTEALRNDPDRHQAILDRIPIGRWAQPEDIAGAVTYLASPAARYVTGITLPVDGGWLGR
ncbi:2-dehydro-3-deoxy-D-gluconate 5-dehydrogenase KduD [Primorskyibacter aestuariivivens]|uniref:2-dehydro-3-deoxy-D-gluconate 5-dehydrogenase KduD n=1 Tax=Primorskyibacter aestuariivivens TaxID=1888912 RepID=UPI002300ABE3|nr:2-dehydro-3-deoxy-D-gluconate 5-dehydrogenase KduD [Primorskyibacter aestuariivivens]MDA7430048.1 2-dehydro-3-deoxy-D-gluconate 5-dehydrogenase KduD [Primorskyibacter aestuariivivens]